MIKEIKSKSKIPNWNETIKLELTLRDLQIIYDAIGNIQPRIVEEKHERYGSSLFLFRERESVITYDASSLIDDIYNELEKILIAYNGIID